MLTGDFFRYWVMGNCLAGETCIFSHDPAKLMNKLALDGASTPPTKGQGSLQLQDLNSFPSLDSLSGLLGSNLPSVGVTPLPG